MGKAERLRLLNKEEIKIDFGCGPNVPDGFIGVDSIKFNDKITILDVGTEIWPWENNSVTFARASHLIEHLTPYERVHFVNELYRVLKVGSKFEMICPHWSSCRAYGDPTHVWPPVSEFWFYYLDKNWRKSQAPHTDIEFNSKGYNCDFDVVGGFNIRQDLTSRNQEYQNFAILNYKEACQDIIATFTKR